MRLTFHCLASHVLLQETSPHTVLRSSGDFCFERQNLICEFAMGVFIRWNGTVEWNNGMEQWNGIVN